MEESGELELEMLVSVSSQIRASGHAADSYPTPRLDRHSDLSPVLLRLTSARTLVREAHDLARRRRRSHPSRPGNPVNTLQRAALDDAVISTSRLLEEAEEAWAHVKVIHPTLLTGFRD